MDGCRICGRSGRILDGHHVVPIGLENVWSRPYNRQRILDRFGFGLEEYIISLCRRCHKKVQEWLRQPENLLLERTCDLCGELILVGFDGEVEVQYEIDGKTCHYDSAEVQIEAFKKDSKRV